MSLARLTVLIDANASGKSNLIEAMRLFAWLASSWWFRRRWPAQRWAIASR